jgi:hypothetical protein
MERRVKPPACDAGNPVADQGDQQFQVSTCAVADQYDVSARQPSTCLQDPLADPVSELLVPRALRGSTAPRARAQTGKAAPRPDRLRGTGAKSIKLIQRRPEALTTWPWLERTGSRQMPIAVNRLPRRRSIGSSMPESRAHPARRS